VNCPQTKTFKVTTDVHIYSYLQLHHRNQYSTVSEGVNRDCVFTILDTCCSRTRICTSICMDILCWKYSSIQYFIAGFQFIFHILIMTGYSDAASNDSDSDQTGFTTFLVYGGAEPRIVQRCFGRVCDVTSSRHSFKAALPRLVLYPQPPPSHHSILPHPSKRQFFQPILLSIVIEQIISQNADLREDPNRQDDHLRGRVLRHDR
jgi:hypothetical protein